MLGTIIALLALSSYLAWQCHLKDKTIAQLLNRLMLRNNLAPLSVEEGAGSVNRTNEQQLSQVFDPMAAVQRDNAIKWAMAETYPELEGIHYEEIQERMPDTWKIFAAQYDEQNKQRIFG